MNVFELAAKISLDKKGFDDGLNKAESRMNRFASGIKNAFGTVAKVGVAAIAAGGSAFAALTKQAFSAAADYEQLVGGVETLFKGAAGKVEQYANEAYKTAGVSANQYMETVTGFSASLLQSLGGDVDKAADIANMALIDMSDNANKMGTDISSIQNAYQGFAKQNYMMLDNLKLGYGGTRTEMERLLKDASALSGVKYDISNLSDVYNAIHVIQTELGITGTTAKEAATTISGSWGMVKAAFGNFLSGGGGYAYKDLAESLNNALDLSIDRLSRIVPRLITQGREVLKSVSGKLPKLMETLMPGVEAGLEALLSTIADILPFLLETGAKLVPSIIKGVGAAFVKVGKKAPEILKGLFDGIKSAAKTIGSAIFGMDGENVKWPTWEDVKGYAIAAWNGIKDGAQKIADFAGGLVFGRKEDGTVNWPTWEDVKGYAAAAWKGIQNGAKLIADQAGGLVFGRKEDGTVDWPTWKEVGEKANQVWNNIVAEAKKLTGFVFGDISNATIDLDAIKSKWTELKTTVENNTVDFISGLTGANEEDVRNVLTGITEILGNIIGLPAKIVENWSGIKGFFTEMWSAISTEITNAWNAVSNWFVDKYNAISSAWQSVSDFLTNIWSGISTAIGTVWDAVNNWLDANVPESIKNVWADIKGFFVDIWNGITGAVNGAIEAIRTFLGLNSQAESKTFTVGEQEYVDPMGVLGGLHLDAPISLDGSHANGLSFVPENDYLATLHFGEAVLSRNEAEKWRNGQSGESGSVDLSSLTNAIVAAVKNGIESANITMDGESVTRHVSRRQAEDVMARRFATV